MTTDPGNLFNDNQYSGREWFHMANKSIVDLEEETERQVLEEGMPREVADALYVLIDAMIDGFVRPKDQIKHRASGQLAKDGLKDIAEMLIKRAEESEDGDVSKDI